MKKKKKKSVASSLVEFYKFYAIIIIRLQILRNFI